jgi:hypothetical protein
LRLCVFFAPLRETASKIFLTGILRVSIVTEVMISTRNFFYFAFTYRYFFSKESGPAKFENDVLTA